jgi:hypothetical protein
MMNEDFVEIFIIFVLLAVFSFFVVTTAVQCTTARDHEKRIEKIEQILMEEK